MKGERISETVKREKKVMKTRGANNMRQGQQTRGREGQGEKLKKEEKGRKKE